MQESSTKCLMSLLIPSFSLLWKREEKSIAESCSESRSEADPAQLSYKSLCPTWCVNLGTKVLLLGFVSEETTFPMNHCASAQWHNMSFWWVFFWLKLRLCFEAVSRVNFKSHVMWDYEEAVLTAHNADSWDEPGTTVTSFMEWGKWNEQHRTDDIYKSWFYPFFSPAAAAALRQFLQCHYFVLCRGVLE